MHQTLPSEDDEHYESTRQVISNSIEYMKSIWTLSPANNRINYKCRNMDEQCSYWAATNKCVVEDDDNDEEDELVSKKLGVTLASCFNGFQMLDTLTGDN